MVGEEGKAYASYLYWWAFNDKKAHATLRTGKAYLSKCNHHASPSTLDIQRTLKIKAADKSKEIYLDGQDAKIALSQGSELNTWMASN